VSSGVTPAPAQPGRSLKFDRDLVAELKKRTTTHLRAIAGLVTIRFAPVDADQCGLRKKAL
jgi:hypothetical protein